MQISPHWPLVNALHYKVLSKKARKEEERGHEFAEVYDIKKLIVSGCSEVCFVSKAESFFVFLFPL